MVQTLELEGRVRVCAEILVESSCGFITDSLKEIITSEGNPA